MKDIELKDIVPTDAKIIIEIRNRLNILGITKNNECYVVSWYNKITHRGKHFVFDTLIKAQSLFNTIMELQF